MLYFKKIVLFFIFLSLFSCGKNEKNTEEDSAPAMEKNGIRSTNSDIEPKDTLFNTPEDSIRAVKESILRKQRYSKKKDKETNDRNTINPSEPNAAPTNKPVAKNVSIPSFVYIKKILKECKVGVPMTQKDLEDKYNIPKEAIGLVKSLTKISENEVDIKWKSTWLIEKVSDAKFKDGRMKMRFDKNKMYTSGGAIGIKYEKKTYTELVLIGRDAYIPSVKGYHWQIGKD